MHIPRSATIVLIALSAVLLTAYTRKTHPWTKPVSPPSASSPIATPAPEPSLPPTLYVALSGSDQNDGRSLAHPLATLQRAADLAQPGDTVFIRTGTYRETVRPARSGTADHPITFTAYQDETVLIDGADPVTGWKPFKDQIYVAPMPADWFSRATPGDGQNLYDPLVRNEADQVFLDNRMVLVARWPNTPSNDPSFPVKAQTEGFISKTEDKVTGWTTGIVNDRQLDDAPQGLVGAEIMVQPNFKAWSWLFTGHVTAVDGTRLTFQTRSTAGKDFSQGVYDPRSRYILFNSLALLDAPGEWFHDKTAGLLYLQAPDAATLEGRVKAKRRLYAFDLTDRSYITIRGLSLNACTITTDREAGGDNIPYDAKGQARYPWINAAYQLPSAPYHRTDFKDSSSTGIVLENITATYLSHFTDVSGHFTCQWGQSSGIVLSGRSHRISGCRLRWSAGNGITLLGREHRALGNLIEDTGYAANDTAAIHTGVTSRCSSDQEIAWNTIRRVGRSAIVPRNLYRSDSSDGSDWKARIHHNDVADFGIQDWDLGGIYSFGDGRWLRIDHNWIHDAWANVDALDASAFSASGIYPDFGSRWIIEHNVIWNVEWGVHLQNQDADRDASFIVRHNTIAVRSLGPKAQPYGPFAVVRNADAAKFAHTVVANNIFLLLDVSRGYKPADFATDPALDRIVENNATGTSLAALGLAGGERWPDALVPSATAADIVDRARDLAPVHAATDDAPMPPEAFAPPPLGAARDLGAFEAGAPLWRAGREAWPQP